MSLLKKGWHQKHSNLNPNKHGGPIIILCLKIAISLQLNLRSIYPGFINKVQEHIFPNGKIEILH